MAYYVMLNFEDADPNAAPGLVAGIKGKDVPKAGTIGSAAAGTTKIYANRALGKSTFWKKKEVVYYPCQEILDRDIKGTLDRADLAKIRRDCQTAKTVGFVIHGTPSDTEHGFSTSGGIVCTWKQLGRLALLLLPDGQEYNVALIMCYAARSQQADLDHNGQIPVNELKTSFAYKFFRSICVYRNIRMSARTGAVSNDNHLSHTVETEEQVFLALEKQQGMQLRNLNKATMDTQKTNLLKRKGLSAPDFDLELQKFLNNPNRVPHGEVETFAKQYMIYTPYMMGFIQNKFDQAKLGNRSKYGKLIYTFSGGVLEIIARYDTDSHGANYSLYRGALLPI
ncbi:MAG: hypothetical protein KGM96_10590 [Acidobacteriota bacterium]|nr:hypothetical protein [Acidobacteriota bacterium]